MELREQLKDHHCQVCGAEIHYGAWCDACSKDLDNWDRANR